MLSSIRPFAPLLFSLVLAAPLLACGSDNGSGGSTSTGGHAQGGGGGTAGSATGGGGATPMCPAADPKQPEETINDVLNDPEMGMFTMDEALAGLPEGPGPLRAIIDTDEGTVTCELRPDKAPNAVANFVGLARGVRFWREPSTGYWVKRRFYDGLLFHRVIPMFMAQGGDPLGTGIGGPGYSFADEISDLTHVPGTLAYANSGANTNGSQFYITETAQHGLDGGYTIFGLCSPLTVVTKLTHVPTDGDPPTGQDRPLTPLHMKTIVITRCKP